MGEKKRLEVFKSKGRKLTEYVKKDATNKSKSRIDSFLKKHNNHKFFLEFRFWADNTSHKVCEDCDKAITIAYTEEDEDWLRRIPQYDIADKPNNLRDMLYDLVRNDINIDNFKGKLDKLLLRAKNLHKG